MRAPTDYEIAKFDRTALELYCVPKATTPTYPA